MSKQIRKIKLPGDNEEYELISTIQTDAAGVEIGRTVTVDGENIKSAAAEGVSAMAQGDYIFRLGATDPVQSSDYRFNEAYGTGSIAAGMGAVAYSRASKSFGYRTQTGMPSKKEQTEHRPEDISIDVSFVVTDNTCNYDYTVEKNLLQYTAHGILEEDKVASKGHEISFKVAPENSMIALSISAPYGLAMDRQVFYKINDEDNSRPLSLTENNKYNTTVILEKVTNLTIEEAFSNPDFPLNITLSAWPTENVGQAAMAIGSDTAATANNAFAGGYRAKATEINSFAFGGTDGSNNVTVASATGAVAMGASVQATGANSFATGLRTLAQGAYSHAEGQDTKATKSSAHAEGSSTHAAGVCAHAEGKDTEASGNYSHAEGEGSKATTYYAHAEGKATQAAGLAAHAEGRESKASGSYSHAEGQNTSASAAASHAAGINTQANHDGSTATGNNTITGRNYQVVIGQFNSKDTSALFVVGNGTADNNRKNAFTINSNGVITVEGNLIVNGTLKIGNTDLMQRLQAIENRLQALEGTSS